MKLIHRARVLGALICLSSGLATAQSVTAPAVKPIEFNMATVTFTLYGNFDEYLNYMRSSSGGHLFALEDGAFLRTRLGLKGLKDVGDGIYMKFVLEQSLLSDNGSLSDTTRLFDRQAWAGVLTPYGEFRAGRQNTAVFFRGDYIDFTTRTLGSPVNAFGVPSRYDSDIAYISPRYEGFLFEAHYSLSGSQPNDATKQKVYQAALEYLNGPYRVGYGGVMGAGAPPAAGNLSEPNIYYHCFYANYEYLPGSKIYLAYLRSNNNTSGGGLNNGTAILGNTGNLPTANAAFNPDHYRMLQVSADYRLLPKLRVGGLYGRVDDTSVDNKNMNAWVVGAYYDIFRDTIVYGLVDALVNGHQAGFRPAGSAGLQTQFTSAADVNGQSIRGVQVGFIYKF
jgi:predicted porin